MVGKRLTGDGSELRNLSRLDGLFGDKQNMRIQTKVQIGRRDEFMILDQPEMDIGIAWFKHDEHGNEGEKSHERIRDA